MSTLHYLATSSALTVILILTPLIAYTEQQSAAFSWCNKTITWIVPFKAGGGTDTWARFNAPFLSKHLPCQPNIIVVNRPGGSSTKAANQYAALAPIDGLTLLATSASTQFSFLLNASRVIYDYKHWQALAVSPTGGVVYLSPELGVSDISQLYQLKAKKLVYASQGVTSIDLVPMLSFDLLGLNVKALFGMRGRGAGRLAFERGESNIDFQTSAAYINKVLPLVKAGKAIPLFTLGALNEHGDLVRDPQYPDLPHFAEVYQLIHGKAPQGVPWESWFAFFSAGFGAQKLLVIPKHTPSHIIDSYQQALFHMHQDPEFLAAKAKTIGSYSQVSGSTAARLYQFGTHIPEAPKQWLQRWLRWRYRTEE